MHFVPLNLETWLRAWKKLDKSFFSNGNTRLDKSFCLQRKYIEK